MEFQPYPFEKLDTLLRYITPNTDLEPLVLTIGEPQFETPAFIQKELKNSTSLLNKYPKTAGELVLKDAMRGFVKRRFGIELENDQLIPTFGTREVLFNFPQFLLHNKTNPTIAFTNPFYQIYEGAAIASRAKVIHLNLTKENNFLPPIDKDELKDAGLVILNYPNNPTSASAPMEYLKEWVEASMELGFVLLNDECYSEIYSDSPDPSLLNAAIEVGNSEFKNILVVNSISKRSSAPGLRSGFIAGDSEILKEYMRYRTYVGCASPLPLQMASTKAWADEKHVEENRKKYHQNFQIAQEILGITPPKSTFYIWLEVDDDIEFTVRAYREKNLKLLPGSFLSRGEFKTTHVRIALVENPQKVKKALTRVKELLDGGK